MNSYYRIYLLWYLTKGMKSTEKSVRCSPATDKENGITSSHKLQKISGGKEEGNYFDVSQSCFLLYWELQNGLKEAEKIFRIFPEHLIVWRETEGVQRHLGLSQESNFFSSSFIYTISEGKESACNAGDLDMIPESGRLPGEGNATHLIILAMDREAWQAI